MRLMRRRIIVLASIALGLAGASFACGLATVGTGDPFGGLDGSADHSVADGAPSELDGTVDPGDGSVPSEGGATDAASESGAVDAGVDSGAICNPIACVASGGTCGAGNVCTIDCSNSSVGACATPTCPLGHTCVIKCGGGDCHGAVSCELAQACDIQCTGGDSCQGSVTCGGAACTVTCLGGGSCHSAITCTAARCNILCSAGDTCTKGVTCGSSIGCSVACSNNAVCNSVDIGAPDAALSCGVGTGGNDCKDVTCYADGGQCRLGCGGSSCSGKVCCSGKCTGTNSGAGVGTCP